MKTFKISKTAFEKVSNSENKWETFCDTAEGYNIVANYNMLAGGLDHITATKKQIQFHDIGCNGRDNSFQIRIQK